ncbi:MAG: hypothetical protein JNJ69_04415 [Leptospiraceae bacterium]|nr:hypothetical protein [Leptospiraceae bacterium]
MRIRSCILTTLFIGGGLYADSSRPEILDRIRDYDLRHSDLLVKIVKDPETLRYAKVRALEKISVLYQQSKTEGELVAQRYLDGINAGLVHKSPDVREAACGAAIVFKESAVAQPIATSVSKALKEENHPVVIAACAHTLSAYTKFPDLAIPALLAKIEKYLTDFQDSSDDEKALREVCHTLGILKARKSFIPLLKLLQSRYDEDVKSAAQEAIQAIRVH